MKWWWGGEVLLRPPPPLYTIAFGQIFKDDVNDIFFMHGRHRLKLNVYLALSKYHYLFYYRLSKDKEKFKVFQIVKKSSKGIVSQDEYYIIFKVLTLTLLLSVWVLLVLNSIWAFFVEKIKNKCSDVTSPGRFIPWMKRPRDCMSHGRMLRDRRVTTITVRYEWSQLLKTGQKIKWTSTSPNTVQYHLCSAWISTMCCQT